MGVHCLSFLNKPGTIVSHKKAWICAVVSPCLLYKHVAYKLLLRVRKETLICISQKEGEEGTNIFYPPRHREGERRGQNQLLGPFLPCLFHGLSVYLSLLSLPPPPRIKRRRDLEAFRGTNGFPYSKGSWKHFEGPYWLRLIRAPI